MAKLFANSEDPDQTPHSAASDLGLHCLPITLLGVSRLQWVNILLIDSTITNSAQQGFKGSGLLGMALFVWSYKNEGTCTMLCT